MINKKIMKKKLQNKIKKIIKMQMKKRNLYSQKMIYGYLKLL